MKDLDPVLEYIHQIDFSRIINKLTTYEGWLIEDAINTCKQYKNFLFLNKKYQHEYTDLPPSEDIDNFWHSHILDTEAYVRDCEKIFGRYMHHYPYFGIDEKSDMGSLNEAFAITQKLYSEEFGEKIVATKSKYPSFIYGLLKKFETVRSKLSRLINK